MSAYVKALMAAVSEEENRQTERNATDTRAAHERLTSLEARLTRLLATIPLEVQRDGISLPALQAALRGRWRGKCHPGELGSALRKLGFTRVRSWSDGASFSAVWRRI